jgi:6-pyruvoyltetrahydropterin/6-carboxytetrahydropterin synthase
MEERIIYITRKAKFSAAHRLLNKKFAEDKNRKIFSKCYDLHGHNYHLEITLKAAIDPDTGMLINFTDLKEVIYRNIILKFDHKYLNDLEEFKDVIPTAENIAYVSWQLLKPDLGEKLYEVKVFETNNSFVSYKG